MAEKKTALITGSYGGLGTCFVNIHAGKGGDLILVGRSQEKLDEQKKEVESKYHVNVRTIAVDLSLPDAAKTVYDTCMENGWRVDYLINNAGFGGHGDFARERTMEQDMSMISVNVETLTRMCKLFLPDLIKQGSGAVLNVSSTAATMPGPLQAVYFASKAYVTSLSNALWHELKLTDNVYHYDSKDNVFELAAHYEERQAAKEAAEMDIEDVGEKSSVLKDLGDKVKQASIINERGEKLKDTKSKSKGGDAI